MIVGWILNFSMDIIMRLTSYLPDAAWPSGVNDLFSALYGPLSLIDTVIPLDQLFVISASVFVIELAFLAFKLVKLITNFLRGSGA